MEKSFTYSHQCYHCLITQKHKICGRVLNEINHPCPDHAQFTVLISVIAQYIPYMYTMTYPAHYNTQI